METEQDKIEQLRARGYEVTPMPTDPVMDRIAHLEVKVNKLENRSGLMSKSWFNRAITVWGYGIGIQLIIAIIGLVLAGMFGYLLGN